MFSQDERCIYQKNQLMEVVCQLRFPTILSIGTKEPAEFQDEIRDVFPRYEVRQEQLPAKVTPIPGQKPKVEPGKQVVNHCFRTEQGEYFINLTPNFISLSCNRYHSWEEFARMMDRPLAAFIRTYAPAYFERVGLRYLNGFSKEALGLEELPWKELIQPAYLGLMASEDVPEQAFARCLQDVELSLPGGCRLKMKVGPGMVKRGNVQQGRMIMDLDVFMAGNIPVNLAAGSMQTVHTHAGSIFRGAITDTLHDAMEPNN